MRTFLYTALLILGFGAFAQTPIAHYTFSGDATDQSGNNIDGVVNGATLTADRFGKANSAYSFDGVDDYINLGNNALFDFTNAFSISVWINPNFQVGFEKLVGKGQFSWALGRDGSTENVRFGADGLSVLAVNTTDINDGNWHHIVGTYDGSNISIYADGVLQNQNAETGTVLVNAVDVWIGANSEDGNNDYNGSLDDVQIYNVGLSASEVSALYQSESEGLVASFTFTGDALDQSGNGNDGTVSGATLTTDRFGNANSAYSFDGIDDFISTPTLSSTPSNITFSAWFYYDDGDANGVHQIAEIAGSSALALFEGSFQTVLNLNGNFEAPFTGANAGKWHFGALTYDGATFRSYLDGALFYEQSNAGPIGYIGSSELRIGNSGFSSYFKGAIDDVNIYSYALTDAEIAEQFLVESGIVASYSFSGNALDETGNGNDGTVIGATLTTDRFGNANSAYSFNGIDNNIGVANSNGLLTFDVQQPFSYNIWVKANSPKNAFALSVADAVTGDFRVAARFLADVSVNLYVGEHGIGNDLVNSNAVSLDQWHMLSLSSDGTNITTYVDGILVGTQEMSISQGSIANSSGLIFGSYFKGPDWEYWDGAIDDVSIYKRALSASEVSDLFQEGAFITTWTTTSASEQITIPINESYTYNYTVNWGDGNVTSGNAGNASHVYTTAGTYTVTISGDFPSINFSSPTANGSGTKIQSIEQWGEINWLDFTDAFNGCTNLVVNATDAPDLTNVTSLLAMFSNTNFSSDFSKWDVSTITNMGEMFSNSTFNGIISNWDVSNVTSMQAMFKGTSVFNQPLNQWSVSGVTEMQSMFNGATSFNQDIGNWDVSLVQNMESMFANAINFNANISGWTTSSLTNTPYMFFGASSFNQDLSGWNVSAVSNFDGMFQDASTFDQNLGSWDISSATLLEGILSSTALTITNYDNTLIGWSTLDTGEAQIPTAMTLTTGLSYCHGEAARNTLIGTYAWTFNGDVKNCPELLAHYSFSGNASDDSDYGNDGTVSGGTLTTDRFGNANASAKLDGIDDYIEIPDVDYFGGTDQVSLSWWVNTNAAGTFQDMLSLGNIRAYIGNDGTVRVNVFIGGSGTATSAQIVPSELQHFVYTYDGITATLFRNGVEVSSTPTTGLIDSYNGSAFLGSLVGESNFLNGTLDDIKIYNRALSETEITDLYNENGWINPREPLAALYASLGGDNWNNNTNWNSEESLSTWYGLVMQDGNLLQINLGQNNLTGSLPPEIGNFQNLENIGFGSNSISGSIPPEIGNLTTLNQLLLFNNQLSGSIPREIGNMTNLINLYLSVNNLTGELPFELGNLSNLRLMTVSRNQLSGAVPSELANLSNLTTGMYLYSNEFSSLPNLTGLPSGTTLSVYNNKIGFADLIANLSLQSAGSNYFYHPQSVDQEITLTVSDSELVNLTTSEATANTNYQWFFNGDSILGAVSKDHSFTYNASLEGTYYVAMTNNDIAGLTITRAPYIVEDGINVAPTDIFFSNGVMKEGDPIGTFVGTFETEDVDPVDSHTYAMIAGLGDGFNDSFIISNDSVFTAVAMDPLTVPVHQFRVQSTDVGGLSVEQVFEVQVSPIQVCNFEVLTASSGTIEDGSGNFKYESNFYCNWLIELSPESLIRLDFTEFETEANYDFVRVYDGSDETATLLAELSGTTIPSPILSSSNTMFITFTTDQLVDSAGFTANYSAVTPVAYYPFDGDAIDASGNGNDGIVTGATLVGDRLGNANSAYSFDGVTNSIQATSAITGSNVPFSIATWVRWNGGSLQEIVSWWNATSTSKVYLGPQASGELRFGDGFGATGAFIPQNEWVHIAAAYDGSVAYIYINGVLSAQSSSGVTQDFAGGDLFIGKQGTNDFEFFDGIIDDLRIYDITLSENEIANLYTTSATDLLAVYNFNGDLSDETGNGFDAINLTSGNAFANSRLEVGNVAYDFDITSGGAIELQNTAGYDFGTEITVSAWIRPDTYNSTFIELMNNVNAGNGFQFYLDAADLDSTEQLTKRRLWGGVVGVSYGPFGEVILDRWTHVAFRYKQNQGTSMFINGVNQGTYGFISGTENSGVTVSASSITMGTDYDGLMDEVKIFNVALTDEEVYEEFNTNRWPFASLAFRGPEGAGANTIDRLVPLNPSKKNTHLAALQLDFDGDYQFRATASDGFEAFMGDNEMDGIAEPGSTQIALTSGFYAVGFDQSNFSYFVEPITSVGIVGSALTGDGTGWNSDIDLTDLGGGIYQIKNLQLFDGEFKLRINDAWSFLDWGSNNAEGTLDYRGANIPIGAGTYTFSFDLLNNKYTIIDLTNSFAVAELDFSGNLTDDSGYGNDGTSASTTYTTGRFGLENTAIVLNGTEDVNLGNDFIINLSNGFTMNLWINPTDNNNAGGIFSSPNSFHQHIYSTGFDWRYFQNSVEYPINGIPVIAPNGQWTMITWVYDGGEMRFYDDGVLVHQVTVFGDLDINSNSYLIGNGFNGAVDAFQWIDGVLSDKEIQYLYTDGVILDYTLDGNINDQSGNAIMGSLPFGGNYVNDRFGGVNKALSLNGSDQYIEVDHADQALITGNEITFEGWFNAADLTGGAFLLNTLGMNAFVADNGTLGLLIKASEASYQIDSSVPIGINEWFHFAGTYDGSISKIYVNGVEIASIQLDVEMNIAAIGPTTIGGNNASNFNGILDDVTIYNYALNLDEVEELYLEGGYLPGAEETDILTFGLSPSVSDTDYTPLGVFENSKYYRSIATANWADAKAAAESLGGHLAVVHSQAENDFIINAGGTGWLGGTDENIEGTFEWVDGTAFDYSNWNSASAEPNGGTGENYLELTGDGSWNDFGEGLLPYIVEVPFSEGVVDVENTSVSVSVPYYTNITSLIADFTLSANATATIAATMQVSGSTINDFSNEVTYTITAENDFSNQDWKVSVELDPVQGDSIALVALYNSTDGPNWITTWNLEQPMSTWELITLNAEGRVTNIDLAQNALNGPLPSEIGNLTALESLYLWGNSLTGSIPAEIGELQNLSDLGLNDNQLTGSIPPELGNLANLKTLELGDNQLSSSIPVELGNLTTLTQLYLYNNSLIGSIPSSIGQLTNLSFLYLAGNNLSGVIPVELGNLSNLVILDLGGNNLTGSIPTELANIRLGGFLQGIYLSDNDFTGSIPVEFGSMTSLYVLTLNNNNLSGAIPDVFDGYTNLNYINLASNNLSGSIPPSLAGISTLEFFDASFNQLSGDIPSGFSSLVGLRFFRVQDNALVSLPDLTTSPLDEGLAVENNKIGFTDIITNSSLVNFTYDPQVVEDTLWVSLSSGDTYLLSTNEATAETIYQWQQDGVNIEGATGASHEISIAFGSEGSYTCVMTNPQVNNLTITRAPIIISRLPSSETAISNFVIDGQVGSSAIDDLGKSIAVVMPYGTEPSALVPVITLSSGATINPESGTPQDFTTTFTYVVTAEDEITAENWTVDVSIAQNTAANFVTFSVDGNIGVVDSGNKTVSVEVGNSTSLTNLIAEFTLSDGATALVGGINQESGITANDFSSPVNYSITSQDGNTTDVWTVTVTNAASNAAEILAFGFQTPSANGIVDSGAGTISVEVPFGTDLTNLIASFSLSGGATATVNGNAQTSGSTPNDFTSPVTYVVSAQDATPKNWVVTVTTGVNTANDIESFTIGDQVSSSLNALNHTVSVVMPYGTDPSALTPSITISTNASINPATDISQDFTAAFTYTVTSESGVSQDWTVTVTNELNDETDIINFDIAGQSVQEAIDAVNHTIAVQMPFGTNISSLTPTIQVSDGATISPNSGVAQSFDNPVVYTVTPENGGTTQDWTVTVSVDPNPNTAPTELTLSNNSVNENSLDKVGDFSNNDPDADTFTYTFIDGSGAADNSSFVIDGVQLFPASPFDYESKSAYSILVQVDDQRGATFNQQFTITVNDVNDAPDIADQLFSVAENSVNGTSMPSAVFASDQDGTALMYSVTGGSGATAFIIDETTGFIQVADETQLDFETTPSFSLIVSVSDGSLSGEATMIVDLSNVNEAPSIPAGQTFSIAENSANGTFLSGGTNPGVVEAIDPDANDAFAFSITGGNGSGIGAFAIDNTGQLSVNDFSQLDFEAAVNEFTLSIQVMDLGSLTASTTVTISVTDVNENVAPDDIAFTPVNNSENTATGSVIGTLSSNDPDGAGDTHSYSLISGDVSSFEIVNNELRNTAVFDFETQSSYVMTIRSTDQGDASYDEELTINIMNVNEATTISLSASNSSEYEKGSGGFRISATITDEDGFLSTSIFYKKVTQSSYSSSALTKGTGNEYSFDFDDANLDNVGLEYYIQTEDVLNSVQQSATKVVTTKVASDAVDISNKVNPGTSVSNYAILAFPFEGVSISNVFSGLGAYQDDWRLIRWNNGAYQDLQSGSVTPGVGYWFITKKAGNINTGGKSVTLTNGAYKINLNPSGATDGQGFTLIGNPFQGTINWADVIQYNIDMGNITSDQVQSTLIGYNGQFTSKTTLGAFEGAFIQSASGISNFEIPASAVTSGGGRTEQVNGPNDVFIDDTSWELDLFFNTASYKYSIGGVGISQTAKDGRDINDLGILPRLELYLDLLFEDGSTRSIKKSDDFKTWSFQVRNNLPESEIDMTWDIPVSSNKTIILVDAASKQIYDLKETSSIRLKNDPSAMHQIYYGDKKTIFDNLDLDFDAFHSTYPNPVENVMTIELYAGEQRNAALSLVGLDGKSLPIGQIQLYKGLNSKMINLEGYSIPAGVYFLKVDAKVTTKILKQ